MIWTFNRRCVEGGKMLNLLGKDAKYTTSWISLGFRKMSIWESAGRKGSDG